ncbi:hypothetical protein F5X68DRAFT_200097 [Plectosphaerella plurivora]|uniref:Uncharacterized protein n=1 Tax=Plectosphaerella plurivora TaxID=936078 RepID=A0A9P8VLK6_9PEZI|nr:hypothetical protein F5X68DRAFT_200097 [Plectosphaerella plurivora]
MYGLVFLLPLFCSLLLFLFCFCCLSPRPTWGLFVSIELFLQARDGLVNWLLAFGWASDQTKLIEAWLRWVCVVAVCWLWSSDLHVYLSPRGLIIFFGRRR